MNVVIIGAGPTGLTLGAALSRRGHHVTAIDPDPGPEPDGSWRRGVMQFGHAHGFRPQVRDLLVAEWPQAWQRWLDGGAEPVELSGPAGGKVRIGVRSQRSTYERALRHAVAVVPDLTVAVGRVGSAVERGGKVVGAVVNGSIVDADLVIDASGRLSRFAAPAELGGDTGMTYLNRTYRRRPGAPAGPLTGPVAWYGAMDGYDAYVFPHEAGHLSVVIIRPTADPQLLVLRDEAAFNAACRAIPAVADWTNPQHATASSAVIVGGRLLNLYRPQRNQPGLVAIGDAVATTAPTAGRGLAMSSMQVAALLDLFDSGADPATIADPFDEWCRTSIRPWVEDHIASDTDSVRRWQGHEIDPDQPLSSAAIIAAAHVDPAIRPYLDGYLAMTELLSSLAAAEPLARAVYRCGWRQPLAPGPTRDDLIAIATTVSTSANPTATVTNPEVPGGGYLLGSTNPEIDRLLHQAALLDREVRSLLDDLGSLHGAAAVDIGCGPRGILPALADRVGPNGRVVGVDRDPVMVAHAASYCSEQGLNNVEVLCGDACSTGLLAATFDLAHIRLLLVNTAEPDAIVREAARLVRPGGLLAVQEVDWLSWHCEPPHPAWDALRDLLHRLWASRGFDPCIGRRLPRLLREAGIRQVEARAHAGIDPHDEPYGHLLVTWARRFEPQLVEADLIDPHELHELATTLESHLDNPNTIVIRAATIQAWGQTAA